MSRQERCKKKYDKLFEDDKRFREIEERILQQKEKGNPLDPEERLVLSADIDRSMKEIDDCLEEINHIELSIDTLLDECENLHYGLQTTK